MNSAIYQGKVRHRRFSPTSNQFRYRIFMMYLDLAELPDVFAGHPLWSADRFNVAWFSRRDHFGDPAVPLDRAVRDTVRRETGAAPSGPIRLLTHLRYFGFCFNPVSFFYCFDAEDRRVDAIVAEVHNTPWLERHPYVLNDTRNEHAAADWRRYRFTKAFHVSPFMPMDLDYDWRFRVPGDRLNVHMRLMRGGSRVFDASLMLERREIDRSALTRLLLRYPPMTLKVVAMIYWQALRLWNKRTPFYSHPRKVLEETS